jgi:hypothetical protein
VGGDFNAITDDILDRKIVTKASNGGPAIITDINEGLATRDAFRELNRELERYTWAAKPGRKEEY